MKVKVPIIQEVEIGRVRIIVPVHYDDEQMPNEFPFRNGNSWNILVEIDTGKIINWPKGKDADVHLKVCDSGVYELLDINQFPLAKIDDGYVPHGVVPGSYGDYVEMTIVDGIITNWPESPNVDAFFEKDE